MPAPRTAPADRDAGFSLVEVLFAMAVFTIVVTVALGIVVRTAGAAAGNSRRVVASGLAARQIESARSLQATLIPDGAQITTETVGAVSYTVNQTANYVTTNGVATVCTSTGNTLAYKLVTVTVTWPDQGTIPPVREDTLVALGVGQGPSTSQGTLAVQVATAAGVPVSGIPVTFSNGTAVTTGSDGCAVLPALNPGSYTASVATAGYVDTQNRQSSTTPTLTVSAGTITRATLTYDTDRTVNLTTPAAGLLPSGLRVSWRGTYVTQTAPWCSGTAVGCLNALPGRADYLFPDVYQVWAGTCLDATSVASPALAVDLRPSSSDGSTAALTMGSVHLQMFGAAALASTVYAVHAADPVAGGGCTSGETFSFAVTGGVADVLLPYGAWKFSSLPVPLPGAASATLAAGSTPTVTVIS
jgi:prepilin-type N-terminal cleavage/methylation domain-containing protein